MSMIQFANNETANNEMEQIMNSITIEFEANECEPVTVENRGVTFVATRVSNVSVRFTGRHQMTFESVSGWVFRSVCGEFSDMVIGDNIHQQVALEWMRVNNETVRFSTNVSLLK